MISRNDDQSFAVYFREPLGNCDRFIKSSDLFEDLSGVIGVRTLID